MIKKGFVIWIIILLFAGGFSSGISINLKNAVKKSINGNTLYVGGDGPGNYTKIQDAIDDALSGYTIFVYSGDYNEDIIINKTITLVGEDRDSTLIWGNCEISSHNINLSGFKIRGNTCVLINSSYNNINNNNFTGDGWGLHGIYILNNNTNNIIKENIFHRFTWRSFYILENCSNTSIINNTFYDNDHDIIIKKNCHNTNIIGNKILGTYCCALIEIEGSNNNIIRDNYIAPNWIVGIELYHSHYNIVNNNTIIGNEGFCYNYIVNSKHNYIHNNTMIRSGLSVWNTSENIIENNTVNDKPLFYLENTSDIIVPENSGQVLLMNCNNITVQNQNISYTCTGVLLYESSNCIITDCCISYCYDEISFRNSYNNTIISNNTTKNNTINIEFFNSKYNTILKNNLKNNYVEIDFDNSNYNTIKDNNIKDMEFHESQFNTIIGNNISEGYTGITLWDNSNNNKIIRNNISNNWGYGINIWSKCDNNIIYHNNFFNNEKNAKDISSNTWDNGYPSGGNYWDDYNGTDNNGDGIGDTPYPIPDENQDNYPLIHPYGSITNIDIGKVFYTIQKAIDDEDTLNNHTIYVKNGTYYENIVVNKSIRLIGEEKNTTIIDGGEINDVILISANYTKIKCFSIQNSGTKNVNAGIVIMSSYNTIIGNSISNNRNGIFLGESRCNNIIDNIISNNKGGIYFDWDSSNNNIIQGNKIISSLYSGIRLYGSSNNTVIGNYVSSSGEKGITLSFSCYNNTLIGNDISNNWDGITLWISSNNTITGNNIHSNKDAGIDLNTHCKNNTLAGNIITSNLHHGIWLDKDSTNNTITGNDISSNNNWGIILYYSNGNTCLGNHISNNPIGIQSKFNNNNIIKDNNLTSNNHAGLSLVDSSNNNITNNNICSNKYYGIELDSTSTNNTVFHNNFIKNYYNAIDEGNNTWDNGYPSGGNYWDDYIGNDTDGDCIGDTPYLIPGGDNMDRYPFMNLTGWINQPPKRPTVSGPIKGKPGVEYSYTVVSTDPNCDDISYLWSWGDESYSSWLGPYKSGEKITATHSWSKGTYNITVKAKDIHGLESDWSEPLIITMPRDKTINNPILRLFESFPLLHRLLDILINFLFY